MNSRIDLAATKPQTQRSIKQSSSAMWASSPWGFRMVPLEKQCQWLHAHGFEHICGQFAQYPGMFDVHMTDRQIQESLKLVRNFGLSYASFNVEGDFMITHRPEDQVELCRRSIDQAAKFAPKVIIVFAGWQPILNDGIYNQVSFALKQTARHAAKYGMRVALENHGGLTTTANQINRLLDQAGEVNLGVNFDPANFLMYGQDPLKELQALRHPIFFTHFKSVKIVDGKKVYCRLGEGMIDYQPILKVLAQHYDGFYGIEYEDPMDVFAGSEDDINSLATLMTHVK